MRLGQHLDCSFAPATLASVTHSDTGPARLEQFFFGLGGPNGPLPLHLTEYLRERNQGTLPHTAKLHYSGHLAAQTRYPDGLCSILSSYFDVPVRIEEYVGQWLELPERSRLGVQANRLGVDLCLGRHVWDRQHKFRLCIGPLSLEQYHTLLPGGAEYQGHELDWELNLILARDQVPALQLDARRRLGFDTWLGQPEHDANDLKLARYYAEQPVQSPRTRSPQHG